MMVGFQYRPLIKDEIRILTLHPGDFDDNIYLSLTHEALLPPSAPLVERLSKAELQGTLPDDWKVLESPEGQYFLEWHGTLQHKHPDLQVDPQLYEPVPNDPDPNFDPKYEALSYA